MRGRLGSWSESLAAVYVVPEEPCRDILECHGRRESCHCFFACDARDGELLQAWRGSKGPSHSHECRCISGQLLNTQLSSLRSLNDVREQVFPWGTGSQATDFRL